MIWEVTPCCFIDVSQCYAQNGYLHLVMTATGHSTTSCYPFTKLYHVTSQKTIILYPVVRVLDFMVIMYGKANLNNIKLCPQNGDSRFLRNTGTYQSDCIISQKTNV